MNIFILCIYPNSLKDNEPTSFLNVNSHLFLIQISAASPQSACGRGVDICSTEVRTGRQTRGGQSFFIVIASIQLYFINCDIYLSILCHVVKLLPSSYRWAWCSVNTRSVFMSQPPSNFLSGQDVYALAPFLDLLNHQPDIQVYFYHTHYISWFVSQVEF